VYQITITGAKYEKKIYKNTNKNIFASQMFPPLAYLYLLYAIWPRLELSLRKAYQGNMRKFAQSFSQ